MGNTLKVEYKFGAWQILLKKPFDSYIFLSHMKYGRKINNRINHNDYINSVQILTLSPLAKMTETEVEKNGDVHH